MLICKTVKFEIVYFTSNFRTSLIVWKKKELKKIKKKRFKLRSRGKKMWDPFKKQNPFYFFSTKQTLHWICNGLVNFLVNVLLFINYKGQVKNFFGLVQVHQCEN